MMPRNPSLRQLLGGGALLTVLACLGAGQLSHAQERRAYPSQPIKLLVPFAPGGSTDIVARVIADAMRGPLGQPVVVENRAGAAGLIGAEAVARAQPDGYTIGVGTISTLAVNPVMLKALRRDPLPALVPVIALAQIPSVFSTHPSLGVTDLQGLITTLRAKPDHYTMGSAGVGSIGHLIAEALNENLGVRLRHIPYQGQGPVVNSALSGETQVLSDQYPSSSSLVQSGRLLPFAVAATQRLPALPGVPTLAEAGYPALNRLAITWFGLVAPAGTPQAVVDALNHAAREAMRQPAVQERLARLGVVAMGGSPQQFAALISDTRVQIQQLVQQRKMGLD
ncbi:tripartite-type tricarboxylate transporter receptor subunit TctC [Comamonas sp. BIGb0152]|uniref:Bug family tripartite tricarboxylate transporter substrate binding protein n=1 Tax=Comamonas sp. BIGb0152 TaxID=2940601 RepID=UPI0021692699|nr:tripartite tricarboxylate transporter substrate-binding protein [Comamonas sp. BIGb0152]MCS4293521.1 tripartite-type tricarboxylate transporter receptor subunit TctC [Comamonas sp. BIGb0152]